MGKILITGANGFIGRHLMQTAVAEGLDIRATDISVPEWIPPNVEFLQGDLTSYYFARNMAEDVEGVVHLAAVSRVSSAMHDPLSCMTVNVLGTTMLFQALQERNNLSWFILGSTRGVDHLIESHDLQGLDSIYAVSKRTSEDIARCYCQNSNFRLLIYRLSDVYGDLINEPVKVLTIFIDRALQNLPIEVRDPEKMLYYSHIKDVTNALLHGMCESKNAVPGIQIRRIWRYPGIRLLDLAELVCNLTNSNSEIIVNSQSHNSDLSRDFEKSNNKGECSDYHFYQAISLKDGIHRLAKKEIMVAK